MSLAALIQAERRRYILDILAQAERRTLNHRALATMLDQYGLRPADEVLRADLRWLRERGCLTSGDVETLIVVTLATRGQDIAEDRLRLDGISRDGIPGGR